MRKFQVLDCTLRDGGYYTDWSFDKDLVRRMVKALDGNKVDIIELGYKSPVKGGPYRKCNDGFIRSIIDFELNHSKFSFMIDAKDYFLEQSIDLQLLRDIIKPKIESPFDICRIALKFSEIEQSMELIGYVQNLGYEVFVNLMQTSILEDSDIKYFNKRMKEFGVEKTYIADSFGALLPLQVGQIFTNHDVDGIHTHDNMNLAFANCVTAIDNGATWCDGTITGMGRGVGNVYTEQLLQWRGEITNDMLDVVEEFQQMKLKHGWGHNPLYMYSGLHHIHPLYVQDLNQSNLNGSQLFTAASKLKNTHSYDPKLLVELKEQRAVVVIPARYKSSRFPGKPLAKINGKEMILYVCEKAEQAVGIENVYVATENEEIAKVVRSNGYSVVITSDNCLTGTDRVAEASQEIDADIFVNVQGDEPVINPEDIKQVIETKKNNPNSVVNCYSKLHKNEDPNDRKIPKMIMDLNDNLIYSSRASLPSQKELNKDNLDDIYKQVCIYAFNKEHLQKFTQDSKTPLEREEDIEINRFLEKGINVKMLRSENVSYAVDYPEDINVIEKMNKV